MGLGVRQESVEEGVEDLEDPQELSVSRPKWHRGPTDHGRVTCSTVEATGTPVVRLC